MSKRDIKAKRWERRAFRKKYGLQWMFWYYAVQALNAITGDAGDGAGANGNMREVETLPVPEHGTRKPYSGTNYTENIE